MSESNTQHFLKFDDCEEAEATFVDDDSPDVSDELIYDENRWPKEYPTGYSFKGKKRLFLKVVENFKVLMAKRGDEKILGNVSFKILDSRKVPHGTEYEVEVTKNKDRGVAILKIFGPSPKKGATLMTNKSKRHDIKFVEILTFDIVKQLLDRFGSGPGDGWIGVLKVVPKIVKKDDQKKSHYCHFCNNGFCNVKNLKVHIQKYHQVILNFNCEKCEFITTMDEDLKKHVKEKHSDKKLDCSECNLEFESENELKSHIAEQHKHSAYTCHKCNFTTMKEEVLKEHGNAEHENKKLSCKDCDYVSEKKEELMKHIDGVHQDKNIIGEEEEMEIEFTEENNEGNKRGRKCSSPNSNPSTPPNKKILTHTTNHQNEKLDKGNIDMDEILLKENINKLQEALANLEKIHAETKEELENKKEEVDKLKKNVAVERQEVRKVREENVKLNTELANIKGILDRIEAKEKTEEKLKKIEENTKLFNKIIEKKDTSGAYNNDDKSKHAKEDMEECDGGDASVESTGYGSLTRIVLNKKLGGKRSSPQEEAVVVKQNIVQNQIKLLTCPQCDFISQNETFFNEHITNVHANHPTCPFCFNAFNSYAEVRKHCEQKHAEIRNTEVSKVNKSRIKPCRFFRNGTGICSPPSGVCNFDHSIIPDNERQLCHHKEACKYKPYCIFLHPEGQPEQKWQPVRKHPARICVFTVNGGICRKVVCHFYHPTPAAMNSELESVTNNLGFQSENIKEPPLETQARIIPPEIIEMESFPLLPKRVPVIVKNTQIQTEVMIKSLSQKLKETKIQ